MPIKGKLISGIYGGSDGMISEDSEINFFLVV
jgi:hypothetical protein